MFLGCCVLVHLHNSSIAENQINLVGVGKKIEQNNQIRTIIEVFFFNEKI